MSPRLFIRVDTGGAAFDGSLADAGAELSAVLTQVVEQLADGRAAGRMLDSNGNTVGTWTTEAVTT